MKNYESRGGLKHCLFVTRLLNWSFQQVYKYFQAYENT